MSKKAATAVFMAVGMLVGSLALAGTTKTGKEIFLKNKCKMCHSLRAAGLEKKSKPKASAGPNAAKKAPDLSDVGSNRDAEWLHSWLKKKIALDGKKHKKKFKGNAQDLDVLINWLLSHKGDSPSSP